MATIETDRPFHESFDNGLGALNHTWGSPDLSVRGEVRLTGSEGMMQFPGGPSAGQGYGTYTFNAKLDGDGPGPALLLWPGDDRWPGQEIDVAEILHDGRHYGVVHWDGGGWDAYESVFFDGVRGGVFHDYQVVWEPGRVTFKVDGVEYGAVTDHVPLDYDAGGKNNAISLMNRSDDTAVTVRHVDYVPLGGGGGGGGGGGSGPAPSPEPAPAPAPGGASGTGGGPGTLTLWVSGDAYQGRPQYTVSVDGGQVGGVRTAGASRAEGESDAVTVERAWASGEHRLTVNFLNDRWDGTAETDRNLYVEGIEFNGQSVAGGTAALYGGGPVDFTWFA